MANRTRLMAALAAVLLVMAPTAATATIVRLVNFVSYTYSGSSADLSTNGVQNLDDTDNSNSLRLELWAFAAPYAAGMNGTRLATYAFPAVGAGATIGPIDSGPVPYTPPANGVWYFAMLLTEYAAAPTNDGYVVRYWIDFPDPEYIGVPPPPNQVTSVEFYNLGLDHYFIAATAQDAFDLDNGVHPGWSRTGYTFDIWDGPKANVVPVCRYYIPPGSGDTHFFSASAYECGIVPTMFPQLIKESDAAFYIVLPDPDTGACASDEYPVYRLWNGRFDSNHRYTTSATVKARMIANGYTAEGYGPDQVAMCSPK